MDDPQTLDEDTDTSSDLEEESEQDPTPSEDEGNDESKGSGDSEESDEPAEPKIALCAIGEKDADTIGEWVDYHMGIGIDKIILYNNGQAGGMKYKIDESLMQGETEDDFKVQIVDFPQRSEYKRLAYGDCFNKFRDKFDWIVFLDIDKFIALPKDESIKDIFNDMGEKYKDYEQIRLNSIMFSDYRSLAMDSGLPVPSGDNSIPKPYMAKTIVNCTATGVKFSDFSLQRNGTPPTQCLPNLEELEPSDAEVSKLDISIMYATSSYMEIMWLDWKREKGY